MLNIKPELITLLFFPEYKDGIPGDLYLVHLFFFLIFIPFSMIFLAASSNKNIESKAISKLSKTKASGYFIGYEFKKD